MGKNMNKKNITIEYYNTCRFVNGGDDSYHSQKIDIEELLYALKDRPIQQRTIDYNGENLMLNYIDFNKASNLWEMIFFKSRSSIIPIIVDTSGQSRQILLNDGEMISEGLCALYDPNSKILAMQRNIYACGTKGIEAFFNNFIKDFDICLESIHNIDSRKKSLLKSSKLKKFKLHVRNAKKQDIILSKGHQYNRNTDISRVIDSALAIDSYIINIEFSVGNSSNILKMTDEDFEVFQELMNNSNVTKFELGFAPDEKSNMQITDFMDSRIHDVISIIYSKAKGLDFLEIFGKMTEKFKENVFLK